MQFPVGREEVGRLVDRHGENIAYGLSVVPDFEGRRIVSLAVASIAMGPRRRQEVHFEFDSAIPLAQRALAACIVEGKPGSIKPPHPGLRELSEEFADFIKDLHVGCRAGTGGLADRRLVDLVAVTD